MADWSEHFNRNKTKSASNARDRLKLVLIQDRTNLSPSKMDDLKDELLKVISKYVAIDQQAVKISMTQDGRSQRLMADIPLKPLSRRSTD